MPYPYLRFLKYSKSKVASNTAFLKVIKDNVDPKDLKNALIDYIESQGLTFDERDLLNKIVDEAALRNIINKKTKYEVINEKND